VEVDPVTVSEEDVQERLDELRARFGTLVGVDRPAQDGDFTSIDLTATIEGEEIDTVTGVSYEIGSGNMLEGLDDALIGASAGEEVEFTSALASGDRVGQESEVTVTLHSVKERELPEVDDEFAQLASEFDTVEELQADLQAKAEQGVRFEQGVQARDRVLDAMLEMTDIPLPDNLVEAEVTSHLEKEERLEDDEHRTEVTESTRRAMKTQFLLDALVIRDEVNVDQGELIEYIMMTAQQYNMNPNEFAQRIDQDGQIPAMVTEVGRRKALAGVLEQAKVVDTDGEVVDLNALNALDEVDEEGLGEDDSDDDVLQDEDRSDTDVSDGGAQEVADPAQELDEDAATEADVETDDEGEADVDSDAGTESEELEPASAEAGQDR
nr:trigger factor [Actinomycetota bacterium]